MIATLLKHKIPPPVIALFCAIAMWWISQKTPLIDVYPIVKHGLIALLFCLGLLFDFTALYYFRKAKTTINPMTPERTSTLVSDGIYRISRNPMYVGLLFLLLAWAVFLQSAANIGVIVVFVITITQLQIKPEEKVLEKHFGNTFTQYRNSVRRWL